MWCVLRNASLLLLLLILRLQISAVAQYLVESWTNDNGLPQNSFRSIIQTRDGYLWLTTFDGLVRFDGVRFTVFDKSNTKGLSTNRFTSLYEDKDGTPWIGTVDGGLTFYRDGVFRSLTGPIADRRSEFHKDQPRLLIFQPRINSDLRRSAFIRVHLRPHHNKGESK